MTSVFLILVIVFCCCFRTASLVLYRIHALQLYVLPRRQDTGIPTELTVLPDIHWTLERLCVIPDACVSI